MQQPRKKQKPHQRHLRKHHYIMYGVAHYDDWEGDDMFPPEKYEFDECFISIDTHFGDNFQKWADALPGSYRVATVTGIDWNNLRIVDIDTDTFKKPRGKK